MPISLNFETHSMVLTPPSTNPPLSPSPSFSKNTLQPQISCANASRMLQTLSSALENIQTQLTTLVPSPMRTSSTSAMFPRHGSSFIHSRDLSVDAFAAPTPSDLTCSDTFPLSPSSLSASTNGFSCLKRKKSLQLWPSDHGKLMKAAGHSVGLPCVPLQNDCPKPLRDCSDYPMEPLQPPEPRRIIKLRRKRDTHHNSSASLFTSIISHTSPFFTSSATTATASSCRIAAPSWAAVNACLKLYAELSESMSQSPSHLVECGSLSESVEAISRYMENIRSALSHSPTASLPPSSHSDAHSQTPAHATSLCNKIHSNSRSTFLFHLPPSTNHAPSLLTLFKFLHHSGNAPSHESFLVIQNWMLDLSSSLLSKINLTLDEDCSFEV